MRSFQFTLESVLEYRKEIENEWEIKLGKINGECNSIVNRIDQITQDAHKALEGCSHASGQEAHSWGVYRWRLESQKVQLNRELTAKEEERNRIRARFLQASRDRKVLSKLRERKMAEYKKYQNRQEIIRLDELSAAKAVGEDKR